MPHGLATVATEDVLRVRTLLYGEAHRRSTVRWGSEAPPAEKTGFAWLFPRCPSRHVRRQPVFWPGFTAAGHCDAASSSRLRWPGRATGGCKADACRLLVLGYDCRAIRGFGGRAAWFFADACRASPGAGSCCRIASCRCGPRVFSDFHMSGHPLDGRWEPRVSRWDSSYE